MISNLWSVWSSLSSLVNSSTGCKRHHPPQRKASLEVELLPSRDMLSVSVTPVVVGGVVTEYRLYHESFHFGTWLPNGVFRPHPDQSDPNGWGTSIDIAPFVASGDGTTTSIGVSVSGNSFVISASGPVDKGGTSVGSWSYSLTMGYDPGSETVRGTGVLSVSLIDSLDAIGADLNVGRLRSNYLQDVPLQTGGTGNTGDISAVTVLYAASGDPRDFLWSLQDNPSHFPTDLSHFVGFRLDGETNVVDTLALGESFQIQIARKPSVLVTYEALDDADQLSAGLVYDTALSQAFFADNVGVVPLVLKSTTDHQQMTFAIRIASAPPDRPLPTPLDDREFIENLYATVLLRQSDPAGFAYWLDQLERGTSRDAIAAGFWTSPEHRGMQVDQYYERILGRAADQPGRVHWVSVFLAGATEEHVQRGFLTSLEFQRSHSTASEYVDALYDVVLERAGDPAGKEHWVKSLTRGTPRSAVATGFLLSDEEISQTIDEWYNDFLGRTSESEGLVYWLLERTSDRRSYTSAAAAILASDEFWARRLYS